MRYGRSAAAALRATLLGGAGALGLLALSAGTATADDAGTKGLLGSVTSVVETVASPVESVVQEVTSPLTSTVQAVNPVQTAPVEQQLPRVSDVASQIPSTVGGLSVTGTVAPVTGVVDSVVSQVPIVNSVIPSDTVSTVTRPVLEAVDTTVAPVLPVVEEALTPVVEVIDPVVRVVDPVVEAVVPVVKPIVDPVLDVVDPVVKPIVGPVTDGNPVVPGEGLDPVLTPGAPQGPDAVVVPPGELSEEVDADALGEVAATPVTKAGLASDVGLVNLRSLAQLASISGAGEPSSGNGTESLILGSGHQLPERSDSGFPDSTAGVPALAVVGASGSASAGSGSSGTAGAADAPASLNFDFLSSVSSQIAYTASLPQGPTYDPGSTPD